MDTPLTKICSKCHHAKRLDEYTADIGQKDGKSFWCKSCCDAYNHMRQFGEKTAPEAKVCRKCGELKPIDEFGRDKYTRDSHASRCLLCKRGESAQQYATNLNDGPAKQARYKKRHPEKIRAYEEAHKEQKSKRMRARYLLKKLGILAQNKAWYDAHPGFSRLRSQRHRSRIHNLPHTFTEEQCAFMLGYWHHRCAACGNEEGLFWRLVDDHFIPVNSPSCPGTIAMNMIPLCHATKQTPPGVPVACNNSKGDTDPHVWLIRRFGPKHAAKIAKAIAVYFTVVAHTFPPLSLTGD